MMGQAILLDEMLLILFKELLGINDDLGTRGI